MPAPIGYSLTYISPTDRWILNSKGQAIGMQSTRSGAGDFLPAVSTTDPITGAINLQSNGVDVMAAMSLTVTASRNAVLSDSGNLLRCASATAIVITIQTDAITGWSANETIGQFQYGVGAVSFAAGAGVTFRGTAPTMTQYGGPRGIMRVGPNEWAYV